MEKSREAMLQDFEKPKVMADNASLEPDWLTKKNKNWDREETWWDRDHKGRSERNFSGSLVNIFYILLLLAELILWIKVRHRYDLKGNMEVGSPDLGSTFWYENPVKLYLHYLSADMMRLNESKLQ